MAKRAKPKPDFVLINTRVKLVKERGKTRGRMISNTSSFRIKTTCVRRAWYKVESTDST